MPLSAADIRLLKKIGNDEASFVRYDKDGFAKLRNCHGFCVFYDVSRFRCRVYEHRPSGCRVYPVIYSNRYGVIVDELCPQWETVSEAEILTKGRVLKRLLPRIDAEAAHRRVHA